MYSDLGCQSYSGWILDIWQVYIVTLIDAYRYIEGCASFTSIVYRCILKWVWVAYVSYVLLRVFTRSVCGVRVILNLFVSDVCIIYTAYGYTWTCGLCIICYEVNVMFGCREEFVWIICKRLRVGGCLDILVGFLVIYFGFYFFLF